MPLETMKKMGPFCREWGIKSWRIAGNSEPTLNPDIDYLFKSGQESGIDMGLITNGVLLDQAKNLNLLTWIGISLDATSGETWSKLKRSPEKNFYRIIENIRRIRNNIPDLDISLKFIKWSRKLHLGRNDFAPNPTTAVEPGDNYEDAEKLEELAGRLGVKYILREALPKSMADKYKFEKCRATPLYATFGADHKFYLCCDVRDGYILTNDYTKNNWKELHNLWGSQKHKDIIATINPKRCKFCSKELLNSIMENIILDGKYSKEYQVNFI
jgi:hypothetical protein